MRKILSVVPLLAVLAVPGAARAQDTREITGRVVQAGTATPLADATVGIIGATGGVRTNSNGEYRIRVPNSEVTVLVRSIGFKRAEVKVPVSADASGAQSRSARVPSHRFPRRSPAGSGTARAADWPAHACIRSMSSCSIPASRIARVRPRCTG